MMPQQVAMLAPFGIRPKGTLAARMLPLGQALARRGHRVTIVAPPTLNPQDAGRRDTLGGVVVLHTRMPRAPGPLAAIEQALLLLQAARAAGPQIVHLFKPKGFGGLAVLARGAAGIRAPLVVDTDDWEGWGGWNDLLPYPLWAKQLFAWQERDLPRRAAAVTAVSHTLEEQVRGWGVPPERIFYLPNGAAPADAPPRRAGDGRTLLLYTRFWEFQVPFIIEALRHVAGARPDARLLLIGRGERGEERELLRLAEQAGLRHMIDDRGWVEPASIPALLAEADLALSPLDDTLINRARGLAKLLELMQAGLPIVASQVGQAGEYLQDGASGLLVPPGDARALAEAALGLLGDAALRARLSAGAQARAQLFSWDRLAEVAEAAYAHALAR